MDLKIISAKSLRSASKEVIKQVEVSDDISRNNFIVVPDRFSLQAEKLLFESLNINSTFNTEVVSISKLAKKVLSLAGVDFDLSSTQKSIIKIYEILLKNEFTSFANENKSYELAKQIYLTISQIKSSGISESDFSLMVNDKAKSKFLDISKIYTIYEQEKTQLDSADLLNLFSSLIENSSLIKNSNFYFAEFDSFTFQTYLILKLIIKASKKVVIGVEYPSNESNKHIFDDSIANGLSKICEELNLKSELVSASENLTELENHIAENLFSFNPKTLECKNVSVVAEKDKYGEVLEIANFVKYKISKGFKFSDINLALSNLEEYKNLIKQVFELENIPYFIDENIGLINVLPIQFILQVLKTMQNSNQQNYLTLINNSFYEGEFSYKQICELINEKGEEFEKYLKNDLKLQNLINFSSNCKKVSDFIMLVYQVIQEYNIFEKVSTMQQNFALNNEIYNYKIYSQLENKISNLLEDMKGIEYEINLKDFILFFEDILSSVNVISIPLSSDSVFVGQVNESYFEERKVLLLLGANVSSLPVLIKDLSLIQDSDIEFLNANINPTVKTLNKRSKLKLFNLLTLAKEEILITLTNVEVLSEFVKSFLSLFTKNNAAIGITYNFYASKIVDDLFKKQIQYNSLSNIKLNDILLEKNKNLTNQQIEDAKKLYYSKNTTSISKMQDFFKCPFLFFARYGLGLQEIMQAEITPIDVGNLFHNFAEMFVKSNFLANINEVFVEAIKSDERLKLLSGLKKNEGYFKYLNKLAFDFASALKKQIENSSFKINKSYIEMPFKIKILKVENDEISISGRIDRIDESPLGLRVIDYKTGGNKVSLKDIYYGRNLQLPIYLIAAANINNVCGAFYCPVFEGDKEIKLNGLFEKDEKLLKALDNNLNPQDSTSEIVDITLISNEKEIKINSKKQGVLKEGNLKNIVSYSKKLFKSGLEESLSGKIDALPFENICSNCEYYSLCSFKNLNASRTESAASEDEIAKIGMKEW